MTSGPLLVILGLETIAKALRKCDAASAAKVAALEAAALKASPKKRRRRKSKDAEAAKPQSTFLLLAELCSDLSFFIIFLLYPGTSTKVFHALFCTEFDGEGEDNSRVLAADYSIDCDSMMYAGFLWPYAVIMLFIYPIGVPLFYYLTLYRDKQELHEIRCLELFIANEKQRAKLGEFLRGKARREYQPEIEEAIEREGELTKEYNERRNLLPGALKKLTAGYEMRTHWFEIFECGRKMTLILVPIFFQPGEPLQLTLSLLICFTTFGMYMMYAPFISDSDDLLSQVCQMQIFFTLVSGLVQAADPENPAMAILLPVLVLVPPLAAVIFQTGLLAALGRLSAASDNGVPTPCGRVGVGLRSKAGRALDYALGVKILDDDTDDEEETTTQCIITEEMEASVPAEVINVFKMFDADKNGYFCYKELRKALEFLGEDVTRPAAVQLIKAYDDTPDGKMQLLEFAALVKDLADGVVRRVAKEGGGFEIPRAVENVFDRFDLNEDNTLAAAELRKALTFYGVNVSDPRAAEILTQFDSDPDGKISLEEFAVIIKNIEGDDVGKAPAAALQPDGVRIEYAQAVSPAPSDRYLFA